MNLVTKYMAHRAKKLQKEKTGKTLKPGSTAKVKTLHKTEEVNHIMAGNKDFISKKVMENVSIFKSNLFFVIYENCMYFLKKNTSMFLLDFLSFVNLGLSGESGIHNVCGCTLHKNPKLKLA